MTPVSPLTHGRIEGDWPLHQLPSAGLLASDEDTLAACCGSSSLPAGLQGLSPISSSSRQAAAPGFFAATAANSLASDGATHDADSDSPNPDVHEPHCSGAFNCCLCPTCGSQTPSASGPAPSILHGRLPASPDLSPILSPIRPTHEHPFAEFQSASSQKLGAIFPKTDLGWRTGPHFLPDSHAGQDKPAINAQMATNIATSTSQEYAVASTRLAGPCLSPDRVFSPEPLSPSLVDAASNTTSPDGWSVPNAEQVSCDRAMSLATCSILTTASECSMMDQD
ncbi:unnamed protein product [Protopolystoma xenopodis]|uniref:Uncharacterized protein n=1 Tax=Protopolystoma xenopodis TaxID=117903 RepID=A0A3S5A786_9PLAT|nr:unnamed protein product [Protopolystoma xenopodis]